MNDDRPGMNSRIAALSAAALAAVVLTMAVPPTGARAGDDLASARAFLTGIDTSVTEVLTSTTYTPGEKRGLLTADLLTWLDVTTMATRALGTHLEAFTKAEFGEFVQEYGRFLADVYLREIARSDRNEKPKIDRERVDEKAGTVVLRTTGKPRNSIATGSRTQTDTSKKLAFHVTYTLQRQRGEWRIVQLEMQGVDLNRTFAEQLAGALRTGSPGDLLDKLRAHNARQANANPLAG